MCHTHAQAALQVLTERPLCHCPDVVPTGQPVHGPVRVGPPLPPFHRCHNVNIEARADLSSLWAGRHKRRGRRGRGCTQPRSTSASQAVFVPSTQSVQNSSCQWRPTPTCQFTFLLREKNFFYVWGDVLVWQPRRAKEKAAAFFTDFTKQTIKCVTHVLGPIFCNKHLL